MWSCLFLIRIHLNAAKNKLGETMQCLLNRWFFSFVVQQNLTHCLCHFFLCFQDISYVKHLKIGVEYRRDHVRSCLYSTDWPKNAPSIDAVILKTIQIFLYQKQKTMQNYHK